MSILSLLITFLSYWYALLLTFEITSRFYRKWSRKTIPLVVGGLVGLACVHELLHYAAAKLLGHEAELMLFSVKVSAQDFTVADVLVIGLMPQVLTAVLLATSRLLRTGSLTRDLVYTLALLHLAGSLHDFACVGLYLYELALR